ncbi:unnamed protein product, partial [Mesorhabditis spiculigera]
MGKTGGRVDILVHRLIEYPVKYRAHLAVQDARFATTTKRQQENKRRHKRAVESPLVNILKESENIYVVPSSDDTRVYRVIRYKSCPCDQLKNMHCSECAACPYSWTCECPSNTMSGISCKHIHLVNLKMTPSQPRLHASEVNLLGTSNQLDYADDHSAGEIPDWNKENATLEIRKEPRPTVMPETSHTQFKHTKEKLLNNITALRFSALTYDADPDSADGLVFLEKMNETIEKLSQEFKGRQGSSSRLAIRNERDGPIREAAQRLHAERLEHRAEHNRKLAQKRKAE